MSAALKIICGMFLVGVVRTDDDYREFQRGVCYFKAEFNELKEKVLGNEEFDIWKPLKKIWCDVKFENEEYLQLTLTLFVIIAIIVVAILLLKAILKCFCEIRNPNRLMSYA
ncbi:hypothetical protein ACFFRR_008775 [Megaselia abdita]